MCVAPRAVRAPGRSFVRRGGSVLLAIALGREGSDYWSSGHIAGMKQFGIWPLAEAAEACFG